MSGRNTARIDGAPKQLSLDLGMLPQRSKRMPASSCRDVLFFAVVPTPAAAACVAQRAEGLRNQYGLRGRRRPTELLHVTLHPVGSYLHLPNDILSAGIQVGSSVEVAPFEVTFDRVSSFRGTDRHPLVLRCGDGIAELVTLQKNLGVAMRSIGLGPGDRSGFTPHVTLLYDRQSVPEAGIDEPTTWIVRELVLVRSLLWAEQTCPLCALAVTWLTCIFGSSTNAVRMGVGVIWRRPRLSRSTASRIATR